MPRGKIGVGFLGAGPVTQAIHLPTLARLTETFAVVHVNDIDADSRRLGRGAGRGRTLDHDRSHCWMIRGSRSSRSAVRTSSMPLR